VHSKANEVASLI